MKIIHTKDTTTHIYKDILTDGYKYVVITECDGTVTKYSFSEIQKIITKPTQFIVNFIDGTSEIFRDVRDSTLIESNTFLRIIQDDIINEMPLAEIKSFHAQRMLIFVTYPDGISKSFEGIGCRLAITLEDNNGILLKDIDLRTRILWIEEKK
jgi:hypothetical protein